MRLAVAGFRVAHLRGLSSASFRTSGARGAAAHAGGFSGLVAEDKLCLDSERQVRLARHVP